MTSKHTAAQTPSVADPEDLILTRQIRVKDTQQFSAVEQRIVDKGPIEDDWLGWWPAALTPSVADVQEWLEMAMLRVAVCGMGVVLLFLAELLGPVPYLECKYPDPDPGVMTCEYRLGPR